MNYGKNLDLAPIEYFCEVDKIIKIEEWKDVKGYEDYYQVSDLGRLKSLSRTITREPKGTIISKNKILKGGINSCGYRTIGLCINNKLKCFPIHQLITIAFLNHKPCGDKLVVNHINTIKTDNRLLNLEIVTTRENANRKHIKSSSEYVGVSWDKFNKKWCSKIYINGKNNHLGRFKNEIDAHNAYQEALLKIKKT